jgi:hypothetical protein
MLTAGQGSGKSCPMPISDVSEGTILGSGGHRPVLMNYNLAGVAHARRHDWRRQEMATDVEIQKFVQRHHGFIPKTGWIVHVKEVHGIATLRGAKRARRDRDIEPCPPEKREAIEEALRHFGVI